MPFSAYRRPLRIHRQTSPWTRPASLAQPLAMPAIPPPSGQQEAPMIQSLATPAILPPNAPWEEPTIQKLATPVVLPTGSRGKCPRLCCRKPPNLSRRCGRTTQRQPPRLPWMRRRLAHLRGKARVFGMRGRLPAARVRQRCPCDQPLAAKISGGGPVPQAATPTPAEQILTQVGGHLDQPAPAGTR